MDHFSFGADYLARLRDREPATLAHFGNFFFGPVRNFVRHKVTGNFADDLVQDIFATVLKRIDAGEPRDPAKLPGYIFGVCAKVIMKKGWPKYTRNSAVDMDLSFLPDERDRADARLLKDLNVRVVQRVMQKLSTRDRDAINRVFFLQQDRETASAEMNVTRENLRAILCRALQRFKSEWDIIQ